MMKGQGKITKKDLAFHEAGHAVVSVLTRFPVKHAMIVPDGENLGSVNHHELSEAIKEDLNAGVWKSATKRSLFRAMVVYLAGFLTEMRVTTRASTEVFEEGSRGDFENLVDYALKCWGPDCQDKIDQSGEEAERLLNTHWEAVEAVAAALLKKKTLSGKTIRKIVMENGGRQYLVRGGLKTGEYFRRNSDGELVRYHPQIGDHDNEVIWHEVPMTVESWDRPAKL